MDEKNKESSVTQREIKRGSGSLLAAARKQQKRTVEEIADELNLSVTQIRTIESDQSEGLPEPTYVRGYIRSYARLLNLDVEEVLEHYLNANWQKGARLDDMPRDIGSADDTRRRGFITPFKVIVTLLILGALGYLAFSGQLSRLISSEPQTASTPATTSSPASTTSSSTENTVDTSLLASEQNQVNDSLDTDNALQQSDTVQDDINPQEAGTIDSQVAAQSSSVESPAENTLTLNFTDTSWIDVRDGDGERLAYKSYAKGELLTVSSATPMSVFIGNAKAVSADLNGQPYDISQHREGVFARFTIEFGE